MPINLSGDEGQEKSSAGTLDVGSIAPDSSANVAFEPASTIFCLNEQLHCPH